MYGYGYDNPKVIKALNRLNFDYADDILNDQQHSELLKLILKNFISELENNFWHPYELSCYIFNCILGLVTFVVLSPILLFEKDLRDEHFHSFFSLPYENIVNYMNKECSKIGVSLG
jgi:predicted PurR-regulated permease PerM